jgi:hypothetical protein
MCTHILFLRSPVIDYPATIPRFKKTIKGAFWPKPVYSESEKSPHLFLSHHGARHGTKDKRVATGPKQQSSPFTKLPLELTLDIVEIVVSQDALHSLERSKSGERLGAIWNRLFTREDPTAIFRPYVVITWQMNIMFAREDEFE